MLFVINDDACKWMMVCLSAAVWFTEDESETAPSTEIMTRFLIVKLKQITTSMETLPTGCAIIGK